ncbi:hypothetical protein AaE_004930 [Aphanomyces astaci]|uniref:Uncharacterized protein n=1 Tax=Aphanomyces astaci TaxID=112090 RepID=A0A6A5ALV4_APHAT|nr:hypothetical protein AaE_004930 [Aphanomyces astaci]
MGHIAVDEALLVHAATEGGWHPANVPTRPGLVQLYAVTVAANEMSAHGGLVKESFNCLPSLTLEKAFRTWRRVMHAIVGVNGENSYKIPRSDVTEDDAIVLELMDTRLEAEGRMSDACDLMQVMVVVKGEGSDSTLTRLPGVDAKDLRKPGTVPAKIAEFLSYLDQV